MRIYLSGRPQFRNRSCAADYEWFDLAHAVASMVSTATGIMAVDAHGFPSAITIDEWREILRKISVGFDAVGKIGECTSVEEMQALEKVYDEGMALFAQWFLHLWD